MNKDIFYFITNIILSLLIGFLVAYPLYLYGRNFLIH